MSLSRAQVQFLATTEPFRSRLAETVERVAALADVLPVDVRRELWQMRQDRTRCRLVTRNKQRRNW